YVGNSLEVIESLEILRGGGSRDLRELCLALAGGMFHLGGVSSDANAGMELAAKLIASGKALEKFREMIELQGGDRKILDDVSRLPRASRTLEVPSARSGYLSGLN